MLASENRAEVRVRRNQNPVLLNCSCKDKFVRRSLKSIVPDVDSIVPHEQFRQPGWQRVIDEKSQRE